MRVKKTPFEKELLLLEKQEQRFIQKRMEKNDSALNRLLAEKVPAKLQWGLDAAFAKAFGLVFEKGTGFIEKSYRRGEKEKQFMIDNYTAQLRGDKKSLRVFSKKAAGAGRLNLALTGVSGVGLGILGVGVPDIALFTGLMLKNIYEIALSFGFEYESESEQKFILRLICGAVAYGEELSHVDDELNFFMEEGYFAEDDDVQALIKRAAAGLSKELLYMKFLQGVPFVGAIGGAYNVVYMKRVSEYAELKYRRRFYLGFQQQ